MAKKIILRTLCALCLITSMAMYFIAPWIKVFGVRDKDLKELRTEIKTISKNISGLSKNETVLDLFDDLGYDITKSDIKSFAESFASTADSLIDLEYNPVDISILSFKLIKYSKTFDSMLEDSKAVTVLRANLGSTVSDFFDVYSEIKQYIYYSLIYTAVLAVVALFGILGIVFSCLGKKRGFVVTYFVLSIIIVAIFIGGTIFGNILAHNQLELPKKTNIYPFYGPVVVFITTLLATIFTFSEKKASKKIAEA